MADSKLKIAVDGDGTVTALRSDPARRGTWTFVYAPGASAGLADPFGAYLSHRLPGEGIGLVRFQFPYKEAGRSAPDRPAVLESTWRSVIDSVREPRRRLAVGGRSMGGRIASQVVALGVKVDAIALFAYPLHPPGNPSKMRTDHLGAVSAPTLFVSGTNDAFGAPGELKAASKLVKSSKLQFLDGADHGFAVKKASGRKKDEVFAEAADTLIAWLKAL